MEIKLINAIYDDNNVECRVGDNVLVRTKRIKEPSVAKIEYIGATYVTLVFDDPLIGFQPVRLRTNEILECTAYR